MAERGKRRYGVCLSVPTAAAAVMPKLAANVSFGQWRNYNFWPTANIHYGRWRQ